MPTFIAPVAPAYYDRGLAAHARGDTLNAIADAFDFSLQQNPASPSVSLDRGIALLAAGAAPRAIADLTRASADKVAVPSNAVRLPGITTETASVPGLDRSPSYVEWIVVTKKPQPFTWFFIAPDLIQQLGAREHLPRMLRERIEQIEFLVGQIDHITPGLPRFLPCLEISAIMAFREKTA